MRHFKWGCLRAGHAASGWHPWSWSPRPSDLGAYPYCSNHFRYVCFNWGYTIYIYIYHIYICTILYNIFLYVGYLRWVWQYHAESITMVTSKQCWKRTWKISDFAASRFGKTFWAPRSCLVCIACPELFKNLLKHLVPLEFHIAHSEIAGIWTQNPGLHHVELGGKWGKLDIPSQLCSHFLSSVAKLGGSIHLAGLLAQHILPEKPQAAPSCRHPRKMLSYALPYRVGFWGRNTTGDDNPPPWADVSIKIWKSEQYPNFVQTHKISQDWKAAISGHRDMMHPLLDGCEPELQKKKLAAGLVQACRSTFSWSTFLQRSLWIPLSWGSHFPVFLMTSCATTPPRKAQSLGTYRKSTSSNLFFR